MLYSHLSECIHQLSRFRGIFSRRASLGRGVSLLSGTDTSGTWQRISRISVAERTQADESIHSSQQSSCTSPCGIWLPGMSRPRRHTLADRLAAYVLYLSAQTTSSMAPFRRYRISDYVQRELFKSADNGSKTTATYNWTILVIARARRLSETEHTSCASETVRPPPRSTLTHAVCTCYDPKPLPSFLEPCRAA